MTPLSQLPLFSSISYYLYIKTFRTQGAIIRHHQLKYSEETILLVYIITRLKNDLSSLHIRCVFFIAV